MPGTNLVDGYQAQGSNQNFQIPEGSMNTAEGTHNVFVEVKNKISEFATKIMKNLSELMEIIKHPVLYKQAGSELFFENIAIKKEIKEYKKDINSFEKRKALITKQFDETYKGTGAYFDNVPDATKALHNATVAPFAKAIKNAKCWLNEAEENLKSNEQKIADKKVNTTDEKSSLDENYGDAM